MSKTSYQLLLGLDPLLRRQSKSVDPKDASLSLLVDAMIRAVDQHHAAGVAAPMFGVAKQIAIIAKEAEPHLVMFNPEILSTSSTTQTIEEGSLCLPEIMANITRPDTIEVRYHDQEGNVHTITETGFTASVIQHELDYFKGKLFIDYIPLLRRNLLIKSMEKAIKHMKNHNHHVHTDACNH